MTAAAERAAVARAIAERVLAGRGEHRTTGRALHALVVATVPHVADSPDPQARSAQLVRGAREDLFGYGIRGWRPTRVRPGWVFRLTTNPSNGRPAA